MGKDLKRAIFGTVIGVLTVLCLSALFAWMILKEIVDISHMDLLSAGVLIPASAAAALTVGAGEGRLKRIAAAELGLMLILGILNLALFDGDLRGILPCGLLVLGTSGAVVLASAGKQNKPYVKRKRKKQAIGKLNKKHMR